MWNTTPVTAIILFASVYLGGRYSFGALFAIMLAADMFLGFYQWQMMVAVYGSLGIAALIGFMMRKNVTASRVLFAALGSSVVFFIITNWAVWQFGTMYAHSLAGLLESYTMALPFFRNSLIGDVLYTAMLFGSWAVVRSKIKHDTLKLLSWQEN
jgi:hypothetical protein